MSASWVFTVCFILYQVRGAPQYLNLAWLHPSSVMNMQIRPDANSYTAPHELPSPAQDPEIGLYIQPQLINEETAMYKTDGYESEPLEYRRIQGYGQRCPNKLFQRSSCLNSTWVRTCTFGGTYRDVKCPENFSCLATLGICIPQVGRRLQTFSCPEEPGIYPDPRNCMVYHECLQGNASSSKTTVCVWPQIYDPLTQSCQMETFERPCYKINCIGQQTAAYPGDPNIYANCTRTGAVLKLNRCSFGYGWIDQTQQCESHYCIKEGNIPSNVTNMYYTCSRIYKRMIRSELKSCAGETIFNETLGICAPPVSFASQARTPPLIVETLYHEVPNVDDLVRNAQDTSLPESSSETIGAGMNDHQAYLFPHSYADRMPTNMMNDPGEYASVYPLGMPFPNAMPFIM